MSEAANSVPRENKPRIYAFVNGGSCDWWEVTCISEDGHFLAGHVCSHPAYGPHDMGVTSDRKHDIYAKHYPNGFEVEWVENARTHEGIAAAYQKHLALANAEGK